MQTQKSLERIFHYQHHSVRTLDLQGEPWFVAADVCAILGLDASLAVNGRKRECEDSGGLDDDEKGGQIVLGQAEQVAIMAGGWKRKRQELQMVQWFSYIPKYIITIDAGFAESASDSDFCALVEHELYHIGYELDHEGEMYISPTTGRPKLKMRGHDVEEFHGVVQRYGASPDVQKMVDLVNDGPTIGKAKIAHACGTCLLKLA